MLYSLFEEFLIFDLLSNAKTASNISSNTVLQTACLQEIQLIDFAVQLMQVHSTEGIF
jgi:hypothetical protein